MICILVDDDIRLFQSPLHIAIKKKAAAIVSLLLERNADITLKDSKGVSDGPTCTF